VVDIKPPSERDPGDTPRPLVYADPSRLAPGDHATELKIAPRFARTVLKDGEPAFFYFLLSLAALTYLVMARLRDSRLGRAWVAIKADELSAASCGIEIRRKKLIAFAVSGFCGGLGGALMAFKFKIVSPNTFEFWMSIVVLCCVVLGGMGNIRGVVIGTVLFIGLAELLREPILVANAPEALRTWANGAGDSLGQFVRATGEGVEINLASSRLLFFGLALVLMMIFRPAGICPPSGEGGHLKANVMRRLMRLEDRLFHLKKGKPHDG
jgi:ABC-type branched-subunit amino acid transport system permease subunit